MALVEILFKVGDGGGGNFNLRTNWADGQGIQAVAAGIHIIPADWNAWLATPGATPPDWLTIPKRNRETLRRWMADWIP